VENLSWGDEYRGSLSDGEWREDLRAWHDDTHHFSLLFSGHSRAVFKDRPRRDKEARQDSIPAVPKTLKNCAK
jgi:hypothetical protein